ncbi:hypothetical protein [Streptomyces sp. NPDC052701]|uniref:hypothetical protein n=1 Tax=Streptomyces sp. NPDC052701 TaxID=3155533 RepID=UPI00343606E4
MPATGPAAPPTTRPGLSLWHRFLRSLHRRAPAPAPAGVPREEQARALLAVLEEAVAAQRPADAAVAACGAPEGACGQAAQDCSRAGSRFVRLRARLWDLPLTDPGLADVRARAGRLLAYDQWMLCQALNLAFTVHPDARTEAARLQLNGLGRPADDLRRLRDSLQARDRRPDRPHLRGHAGGPA